MYGSMEQSTPAEAPALGPAELKAVRKLLATNGDDARSAGLSHESQASSASTLPTLATQALSTSTLAKLEAASDEVELQQSVWDASLFLFNPVGLVEIVRGVAGRRSKQPFYRETALLAWAEHLCSRTRPQAVVPVLSGSVRVPPRRRRLPVDVS